MNTIILEETENGDIPVDVFHKLTDSRIIFVTDLVNDQAITDIIATLILKDAEDEESKITLFINSTGGSIRNALMLYDMMNTITAPIETICIGTAFDEAAIILAGGTEGMRRATKHSVIAVSQLENGLMGGHTNIVDGGNLLDQFKSDNNRLLHIISQHTGKSLKQVKSDFDRRHFFNAKEAKEYGLIDSIVNYSKK